MSLPYHSRAFSVSITSNNAAPAVSFWARTRDLAWPTFGMALLCAALFCFTLMAPFGPNALHWTALVLALTLHSSLSHELLHGHPLGKGWIATLVGIFQPGLFVPYLRFRALHLAHHRDADLTDPYDDPESNYLDPAKWHRLWRWQQWVLRFNNTLLGRMLIGPVIGIGAFVLSDLRAVRAGQIDVLRDWLAHLPGVILTLWLVDLSPMDLPAYLGACYAALSVLRIRTFLEHRAHERSSARTVIIEDRGLLALLFLNNNYHLVHHMHPQVAWYRLPAIYHARKSRFQNRNQGYVYRSYAQVFAQYFLRAKDPVAHPHWQGRRD
ncbi:Fatty acid desaturase family protein [Sulfitobacter noctilucae]|uniref:fatty acid desaturase n=1 Tax=Sulfitobacter noctilucae TaxID=1342302 RepID=UPI00046ADA7C|nr:fatty acid desaturase [Sulfitobacter noctilucae]KIN60369.1 Fatty acid desaturase family protein [Sulfitobacter noctilucae]